MYVCTLKLKAFFDLTVTFKKNYFYFTVDLLKEVLEDQTSDLSTQLIVNILFMPVHIFRYSTNICLSLYIRCHFGLN